MSYFPGSTLRTHGVGGPSSSSALMNLHANGNTSTAAAAPARTRTNPSRISKTTSRSLFPGQTTYSGPLTSLLADPYGNVTSISPSGGLELNSRGHGLGHGQGHGNAQGYAHSGGPAHGIYPAITHFTDAIGALPREFQRHASLLKEVNSKAWRLEEVLPAQLDAAVRSTPFADAVGRYLEEDEPISASVNYDSEEGIRRRKLFGELRATLSELIVTADEKNHVLWNANNELQKHAYRLDTVYPYVQGEVSEEARLGSTTHWAYSKKTDKPARTSERPRREAANHHHHHGADGDGRREGQRKHRRGHADDDERPAGKRANTNTSTSTASKRRRVEKPAPATHTAAAMERSVSAATIGARATSKDVSTIEAKKRGRGPANNVNKRPNTAASVTESPHLPSSPAPQQPAQPAVKAPSPPAARPPSSRAQAPAPLNGRQQPQSAASNRPQTNGKPGNNKPSPLLANDSEVPAPGVNGEGKAKPDAAPKREEIVSSNSNGRPRSEPLELATSGPPRSRSSKTSTPIAPASEALPPPPPQRTRSLRTANGPRNAQHKKRGSVASSHNLESDDESYREPRVDDERKGEDDDEDDESEPRYCYCNQVSYGEMVACDNDACPREWFHLSCVGLAKSPAKNEKWYCNECKEGMRRGRSGGK